MSSVNLILFTLLLSLSLSFLGGRRGRVTARSTPERTTCVEGRLSWKEDTGEPSASVREINHRTRLQITRNPGQITAASPKLKPVEPSHVACYETDIFRASDSLTGLPRVINLLLIYLNGSDIIRLMFCSVFLPARRYASAGNCDRNVSVCPSVRHAPVLCQNEES